MYDLVAIGFGPSNLALAIALEEELGLEELTSRVLFLEKEPTSRWHPGLMLPGATLQVSFLKDLVTLRNPTSPYTFVNYLKHEGRLDEFVNLRTFFPTRVEFARYIEWVAGQFAPIVRYEAPVKVVVPLLDRVDATVDGLRVETEAGDAVECRNLVAASGGVPHIPPGFRPVLGPRVFHSSEYLLRIPPPDQLQGATVAVMGGGQSAGEIIHHLITSVPDIEVVSIVRDFALLPMDDSQFMNEVFFPSTVDFTYGLRKQRRDEFLESVRRSNYSAVDVDLIQELYALNYEARVSGRNPLRFLKHAFVDSAEETGDTVTFQWHDRMTQEQGEVVADYVVLATGFRHPHVPEYLRPLLRHFEHTEGHPLIRRDYRVECGDGFLPHVYLQGFAEHTHGISDTLLSIAAHRAGTIASQLTARLDGPAVRTPEVTSSNTHGRDGDSTDGSRSADREVEHARHSAGPQ